jgi:hypothetical protein
LNQDLLSHNKKGRAIERWYRRYLRIDGMLAESIRAAIHHGFGKLLRGKATAFGDQVAMD